MIKKDAKILLMLAPYWTPQIPPLGISSIKSYLLADGFTNVKIVDWNIDPEFKELLKTYNGILYDDIEDYNRSNFYNLTGFVLQDLLSAFYLKSDYSKFTDFIQEIVFSYFFQRPSPKAIIDLIGILELLAITFRNRIERLMCEEEPDVVGFSAYSGTLMLSIEASRIMKKINTNLLTLIGGGVFAETLAVGSPNFTKFLTETENDIDKIVVGEGEILILKILNGELDKSQRVFSIDDIKRSVIELSKAPFPDYTELAVENYPHLSAYTSRSCPYQCTFCSETVYGGTYRKKSPSYIVEELNFLAKKHKYQLFLFGDSLLNPLIDKLSEEMMKSPTKIYWDGYLRADKPVCDVNNTIKWRKGGYYRARLGVESGSDKVLKLMHKQITAKQIKEAICSLANAGIKTTTYWIVGHPGETEEDFQMTLDLIREIKDSIYEIDCNPFWFEVSGMINSSNWVKEFDVKKLYDDRFADMTFLDTWILDCYPKREEIFSRLARFVDFYKELGIPNPYSLKDIYDADERWQRLHRNAVPPMAKLLEFRSTDKSYEEENINFDTRQAVNYMTKDDGWN